MNNVQCDLKFVICIRLKIQLAYWQSLPKVVLMTDNKEKWNKTISETYNVPVTFGQKHFWKKTSEIF